MKRISSLMALLGLLVLTHSAQAGWQGSATADYAVKATMDSFVGKAKSEPIVLAEGATEFPVTFLIAKMDSDKKKRDLEMQHMFKAEEFPEIVGRASAEAILGLQAADTAAELPIALTISGQTHDVPAKISEVKLADGQLTFTAYLEISLKSFGLKPPSIMKIINVGDVVKVTTKFTLIQDAAPAAQP